MAGIGNYSIVLRDYRKGNWTLGETMVLIEAKKMDDERRLKRVSGDHQLSKPAELRWKWVEDYCWRKGCLRSQNQCNDKWDNLMRDYKKVRDYERRINMGGEADQSTAQGSYWKIGKIERKDNNLPSNMLPQIYEALVEVEENKGKLSFTTPTGVPMQPQHHHTSASIPPPPLQPPPAVAPPPPQPPQQPEPPQPQLPPMLPCPQPLPTMCDGSDSDTSHEYSDSPAKRRRRGEGEGASASNMHEVGTAISKSASIIAGALQACEDREERRHRELLSLHERRLRVEESKAEVNRQGLSGLVDAINKLANSVLALASHNNQSAAPPK